MWRMCVAVESTPAFFKSSNSGSFEVASCFAILHARVERLEDPFLVVRMALSVQVGEVQGGGAAVA